MLCARFTARFADSKLTSASSASLHHVIQGDNESLRQYMTHFTKATLLIPDLHSAVTRHSLLVGLKPSALLDSLYADPPPNMDALRARAARYMSIEENANARKRNLQPQITKENPRLQKKVRPGRYNQYTPLNATWEAILQEACSRDLVRNSSSGTTPTRGKPYSQVQLPPKYQA